MGEYKGEKAVRKYKRKRGSEEIKVVSNKEIFNRDVKAGNG